MLWVLGPNIRRAYLRVARASGVLVAWLRTRRHAGMAQNDRSHAHIFSRSRGAQSMRRWRVAQRPQSRRRRARGPPEPPKDSCLALRRLCHLARRLAAPCRRLAAPQRPAGATADARREPKSSKNEQANTKKTTATAPPMVAALAVVPAALCSNESSAGQL